MKSPDGKNREDKIEAESMAGETAMETFQSIQQMTVMEKVKLATFGNKEVRRLLIRDTNKVVQVAVVNNPKITEEEIQQIASLRSVDTEILRIIRMNRDWVKKYPIKLALIKNPKTPLQAALGMVSHLRKKDLKELMGSKNISNPLRQAATHLYGQSSP